MTNKCPQCGGNLKLYINGDVVLDVNPETGEVAHTGPLVLFDNATLECPACAWSVEKDREHDYRVDGVEGIE